MRTRPHDPLRLDVAAFTAEAGTLEGRWPGESLPRLAASETPPQDTAPGEVIWRIEGERVPVAGGEPELWLRLKAEAAPWLTCQRCLQPYREPLAIDRRLRFVRDEGEAEVLDAESEDDVLALTRWLDLRDLIEDELLLALPLVPRHETCPQPLAFDDGAVAEDLAQPAAHPFAALEAMKTGRKGTPDKAD